MPNLSRKSFDRQYTILAFKIAADFGATIAVPVVILVIIGQWLDGKYSSGPWFTVAGFVIAALLSAKMIHSKAKQYGKEYESIDEKTNEK